MASASPLQVVWIAGGKLVRCLVSLLPQAVVPKTVELCCVLHEASIKILMPIINLDKGSLW